MATWTQTDVDTLKTALASGILTVIYDGPPRRAVTYQSTNQMRELLAAMIADVANSAGTRQTYRLGSTRKGL